MTAATLYARYSSALQSPESIEDQLRLLRQRAAREGWSIAAEHADHAISGSVRDRPGLAGALADIEAGRATILLAESLDRISRDQEDIAGIHKRIRFGGARIVTLSEGEIGAIHIGMGGTVSALFLEQLAAKTIRGQIGRVEAGRIPGGLSYGYRKAILLDARGEPERGLREIDEPQAAVIRRIFADYIAGRSPRQIAMDLNAAGVPAPRGGLWRAGAIGGHRQRGNGVLHNALYRGQIVFNRQSFRKDPDSRKRVSRANQPAELVTAEVPALRIVDEPTWLAAQALLARFADRPAHQARRPKRLLSGLMHCGVCGGTVTVIGADRWGCSTAHQTKACANGTTISDAQAQKRLWRALQDNLLHPDVIAAYVDELRIGLAARRREWIAQRAGIERRLAQIHAEDQRIVDAIVAGIAPAGLVDRSQALAAERESLEAQLQSPQWEALERAAAHPAIAENYRRRIAELQTLVEGDTALRESGRALLADLIDRIDVTPRPTGQRGADLTVHGKLATFLNLAQTPKTPPKRGHDDCTLAMVAGAGFARWHTMRFAA